MEIINKLFIFCKDTFHKFAINTAIMLYLILRKIYIFCTCGHLQIPSILLPYFAQFHKTIHNFHSLNIRHFCLLNIFFCKICCFFYQVVLHLSIGFNINKAENKFICVTLQLIANMPDTCQQHTRCKLWCHNERVKTPYYFFFTNQLRQFFECLYSLCHRRNIWFKALLHIIIQRYLEIIMNPTLIKFRQIWDNWLWILCPKHNYLAVLK